VALASSHEPQGTPIHPALDLSVFRQMADMSNDAFFLTDSRGRFLYVNHRAVALAGYSRQEILNLRIPDVNPEFPPPRLAEFVASLGKAPMAPFETLLRRKDGVISPIELSVARIEVTGAPYLFGVVRDITERKQLQASRKSFAQRLLKTLEAERQRVARELHDDVGQAVATVGVLLHALEQRPGAIAEEMRPALTAMQGTIRQITESVARLVRDHHPAELLGLGFEETLRAHVCEFTQRHELELRLATVPVAGLLPPEQELHLYRIVQEALANVARHAQARRVTVRLTRRGSTLLVVVRDDGVGFDTGALQAGSGFGLVTMRERAEILGAELSVRSAHDGGTEVRVTVPLAAARPSPPAGAATEAATPPGARRRRRPRRRPGPRRRGLALV